MATKKKLKLFWTDSAKFQLKEILTWYKKRSDAGKMLVKNAIFEGLNQACKNPFIYETDRFKEIEDINVRAFTVYHTRVTFMVTAKEIIVLRVRHTSREPFMH